MTEENENASATATNEADGDDEGGSWWQTVLWGVVSLVFAGFLWWYFTDFENSSDTTRRMNAILALLYNVGGKTLAVGVVAAIGLGAIGLGGWEFAKRPRG